MKIKVSVIVPIYNTSQYLDECLKSLVNQTLKEIEIICINDGSTDNSLNIIKTYAEKYKQIKIINKKNTGYGDSVNIGIAKSGGKYFGIVEPDDFIEVDAFEKLFDMAEKESVDIVRGNFYFHANRQDKKSDFIKKNKKTTARKSKELFMSAPAIWSAIYRRSFVTENKIELLATPGASYQDAGFYFKTLMMAKDIYLTKEAFLHYRIDNENSSVKSTKKVFDIMKEHQSIKKFMLDRGLLGQYGVLIEPAKFANYLWNIQRLKGNERNDFIKKVRNELLQDQRENLIIKDNFSKKHWLALKMLLRCPRLFIFLSKTK